MPLQLAQRELLASHMICLAVAIACSFAAILAILGPFFAEPFLSPIQRLTYVVPIISFEFVILYSAFVVTIIMMRFRPALQIILSLAVMVLIVAAPSTAMLYTVYMTALADHFPNPSADVDLPATYMKIVMLLLIPTGILYYALHLRVTRILPADDG